MNIYLISQSENDEYDTYDSAVVCAPDEETARNMNPSSAAFMDWSKVSGYSAWATSPDNVCVKLIGLADDSVEQGVVCASFNAG